MQCIKIGHEIIFERDFESTSLCQHYKNAKARL